MIVALVVAFILILLPGVIFYGVKFFFRTPKAEYLPMYDRIARTVLEGNIMAMRFINKDKK